MKTISKTSLQILSIAIITLLLWSFKWNNPKITGTISLSELPSKIFLLQYDFNKNNFFVIDTLLVDKKGDFSTKLPKEFPQLYQLEVLNEKIEFPVDDHSEIIVNVDSAQVIISGSKQSSAIVDFKNLITEANERHFADLIKSGADRKKMQDKAFTKKLMKIYKDERLSGFYHELEKAIDKMEFSVAAIYCLNYLDMNKNYAFIKKKIETFNSKYQNSGILDVWNKKVLNAQKIQIGSVAPWENNINDLNGNLLEISDLKGKYIVVDFWAGWCKPCLIEFSFYAELYQKYHQKGLVIIGVNKDFKEEQCRNLHKKFNLPWYTVYDGENKLSELYMVKQLPQNIVIDKKGQIIAKNLLVWEIEELLKDQL